MSETHRGRALFTRGQDGSVILAVKLVPGDQFAHEEFTPDDWASIVASMSLHGDTARAFGLARRFHFGRWGEARKPPNLNRKP